MPDSVKPVFAGLSAITFAGLFFFIGIKCELFLLHTDLNGFSLILNSFNGETSVVALRSYLTLQTIALFAIPPLVIAWCYGKNVFKLFLLRAKPPFFYLICSIILIIFANPVINLLVEYNGFIADSLLGASNSLKTEDINTQKLVESLLTDTSILSFLINTIVVAFLPAVFEELFFRGFLQKVVLRKYVNVHVAIISTAFFFSFIHFQFYGFIPRFLLGVVFGYILEWSGSLLVTIIIHFMNNFMAVVSCFLVSHNVMKDTADSIGTGSTMWLGLLSAFVVVGIIFLMYRKYQSFQNAKTTQTSTFA